MVNECQLNSHLKLEWFKRVDQNKSQQKSVKIRVSQQSRLVDAMKSSTTVSSINHTNRQSTKVNRN